jgi:hypothetical protein
MSFKSNINNSYNSNINKTAKIYSYKYYSVNHFINFMSNAFIKSSKLPFISISLFIIVIVLNSIQYANDKNYLQNQIKNSTSSAPDSTSPQNVMLYIYDLIGINGFTNNGLVHILYFILSYICLSLVEMNIGHIKLVFFLIVLLMFQFFTGGFTSSICQNNLFGADDIIRRPYCCGSFIMWASLGFTLFIIQKHTTDLYKKIYTWFLIGTVWAGCVLFDNFFALSDMKDSSNQKNCEIFFWHSANYLLGLYCGFAFAN